LVPAVGTVSRSIGKKLTRNKAKFVDAITRAGNDANEITKAYLTSVPKAKRSVQDLADLLSDPNINIDELKMIANETLKDAIELAKGQRSMNAAVGALTASGAQRISSDEGDDKPN
jgi:hypothetical protein